MPIVNVSPLSVLLLCLSVAFGQYNGPYDYGYDSGSPNMYGSLDYGASAYPAYGQAAPGFYPGMQQQPQQPQQQQQQPPQQQQQQESNFQPIAPGFVGFPDSNSLPLAFLPDGARHTHPTATPMPPLNSMANANDNAFQNPAEGQTLTSPDLFSYNNQGQQRSMQPVDYQATGYQQPDYRDYNYNLGPPVGGMGQQYPQYGSPDYGGAPFGNYDLPQSGSAGQRAPNYNYGYARDPYYSSQPATQPPPQPQRQLPLDRPPVNTRPQGRPTVNTASANDLQRLQEMYRSQLAVQQQQQQQQPRQEVEAPQQPENLVQQQIPGDSQTGNKTGETSSKVTTVFLSKPNENAIPIGYITSNGPLELPKKPEPPQANPSQVQQPPANQMGGFGLGGGLGNYMPLGIGLFGSGFGGNEPGQNDYYGGLGLPGLQNPLGGGPGFMSGSYIPGFGDYGTGQQDGQTSDYSQF